MRYLDDEDRKEFIQDTYSKKRKEIFKIMEKSKIQHLRDYKKLTVDQIIEFLHSIQEVSGPFPISQEKDTQMGHFIL